MEMQNAEYRMQNAKCKMQNAKWKVQNVVLIISALVLWCSGALSGVIYDPAKEALYRDKVALKVGDLVTIIVVESATATNKASTETSKEFSTKAGPGLGWLDFIEGWGISSRDEFEGSGTTRRSGSLTTRLTARIVEILPTGNYKIESTRILVINEEQQKIVLSGIVRPEDINRDNTIYSTYISDAKFEYKGRGAVTRKQRCGLFCKLFDWLF